MCLLVQLKYVGRVKTMQMQVNMGPDRVTRSTVLLPTRWAVSNITSVCRAIWSFPLPCAATERHAQTAPCSAALSSEFLHVF